MKEMYEKMTVILLQADEESARQNREHFSELGLEVLGVCANGMEAVRVISEQQPDVVLMDSFLPGRSSYDIIEALNSDIILRYAYRSGVVQHAAAIDSSVNRAVELLLDSDEYERILREQHLEMH
jgi:CheY-like chemotaxis protein